MTVLPENTKLHNLFTYKYVAYFIDVAKKMN